MVRLLSHVDTGSLQGGRRLGRIGHSLGSPTRTLRWFRLDVDVDSDEAECVENIVIFPHTSMMTEQMDPVR